MASKRNAKDKTKKSKNRTKDPSSEDESSSDPSYSVSGDEETFASDTVLAQAPKAKAKVRKAPTRKQPQKKPRHEASPPKEAETLAIEQLAESIHTEGTPGKGFVSKQAIAQYTLSMSKRQFTFERASVTTEINLYCPNIWTQIETRNWQRFVEFQGDINKTLVREFYANIHDKPDGEWTIKLRGKMFRFDPALIDDFFGIEYTETPELLKKLKESNGARAWVASVIAKNRSSVETLPWVRQWLKIKKAYLCFEAKAWWGFVNKRLHPTTSDNTLIMESATLVASLMSSFPIDVGAILNREINKVKKQPTTNLIFGNTLTALMRLQGIPELPSDTITGPLKPYDMFNSTDPDNPKKLARQGGTSTSGQSEGPITTHSESTAPSTSVQAIAGSVNFPFETSVTIPQTCSMPPPQPLTTTSTSTLESTRGPKAFMMTLASWMQRLDSRMDAVTALSPTPSSSSTPSETQIDVVALNTVLGKLAQVDMLSLNDTLKTVADNMKAQTDALKTVQTAVEGNTTRIAALEKRMCALEKKAITPEILKKFGEKIADMTDFDFADFMTTVTVPEDEQSGHTEDLDDPCQAANELMEISAQVRATKPSGSIIAEMDKDNDLQLVLAHSMETAKAERKRNQASSSGTKDVSDETQEDTYGA